MSANATQIGLYDPQNLCVVSCQRFAASPYQHKYLLVRLYGPSPSVPPVRNLTVAV